MPFFSFPDSLKPTEALDLLLNIPQDCVCSSKPVGITKAATFVISTNIFDTIDDIKADDLGVWVHKGKPIRRYKVNRSESGAVYGADLTKEAGEDVYQLIRVYYHHKHTPTFRRTLFYASCKLPSILTS